LTIVYEASGTQIDEFDDDDDDVENVYDKTDHAPAVLKIKKVVKSKAKPFKILNFLVHKPEFKSIVDQGWKKDVQGHNMFQVVKKLKSLKQPLRNLLKNQGNLHDRVVRLRHELDEVQKALDKYPARVSLREEEGVYLRDFNESTLDEERFLKLSLNGFGNEKADYMVKEITNGEIKDAMFSIGNDKAPIPDGFTLILFKKSSGLVGND
nr:hypothetical protein [Tanacetum cinerariifolium]